MTDCDICIVTQLHPSMNPRVVKEADTFAEAGYRTSVIAPDFSEWGRSADREFDDRPWEIVARPQFGPLSSPDKRIAELCRRLLAGLAVRKFGVSSPTIVRAAIHPVAPRLVSAAKEVKARLYVGHMVSGLPAAAIAARRHNARYAFDAEDFHPGDMPDAARFACEKRMIQQMESRYLPGCAYVTAASPLISEAYRDAYGIGCPKTVLNVFPQSHAPAKPTDRGTAAAGPSVYWFSQTIGPERGLECAIRAIGMASSRPHLFLRGKLAEGYITTLQSNAAAAGVADRLHILPPAPPSEMERLAAGYDVGFVGETGHTRNRRIALTNKQFSYLLAGLPVVMSDIPSHLRFAESLGPAIKLYRTDDPPDLARALDEFLLDPEHLRDMRRHAFRLGQDSFNWEIEKSVVLSEIKKTIGPAGQTLQDGGDLSEVPCTSS